MANIDSSGNLVVRMDPTTAARVLMDVCAELSGYDTEYKPRHLVEMYDWLMEAGASKTPEYAAEFLRRLAASEVR